MPRTKAYRTKIGPVNDLIYVSLTDSDGVTTLHHLTFVVDGLRVMVDRHGTTKVLGNADTIDPPADGEA